MQPRTISVIIPALNEESCLGQTLAHLGRVPQVSEVIVVDGGSRDKTREIARSFQAGLFEARPGRGRQIRAGCLAAQGDVLWILHADTRVEPESGSLILTTLKDESIVGGGCLKVFDHPTWLMAGSVFKCRIRHALCNRFMSDQALFIRRDILEGMGGFPDVPLMEEYVLCKKMAEYGRLALVETTVTTSARKFREHGPLRTYLLMARVTLGYLLGEDLEKLAGMYQKRRGPAPNKGAGPH